MKRSKDEAEVIVRLDYSDGLAHITVSGWPSMARKMERLYDASRDGESRQSRRWTVPLRCISFRREQRNSSRKRAVRLERSVKPHSLPQEAALDAVSRV